jgi:hypothetical protein
MLTGVFMAPLAVAYLAFRLVTQSTALIHSSHAFVTKWHFVLCWRVWISMLTSMDDSLSRCCVSRWTFT